MICSIILEQTHVREIGRNALSEAFLGTGTTFPVFQSWGTEPVERDCWKIWLRMMLERCLVFLRIFAFMPSTPEAEDSFRESMTFEMPCGWNVMLGMMECNLVERDTGPSSGSRVNTEQNVELRDSATLQSGIAVPEESSKETVGFTCLGLMVLQNCLGLVRIRAGSVDEKKVRLDLDRSESNFFDVARYLSHVRGSVDVFAALNCLFLFLLSRFKVTLNHGDAIRSVIVFVGMYFAIKRCVSYLKIDQFVSTERVSKSNKNESQKLLSSAFISRY